MTGLKKIITGSFILFLLCLSASSIRASVISPLIVGKATSFRTTNIDRQHANASEEFVMELIDDDSSEKSLTDLAFPNHLSDHTDFSNALINHLQKNANALREFYTSIKPVTSAPSFLMIFRI